MSALSNDKTLIYFAIGAQPDYLDLCALALRFLHRHVLAAPADAAAAAIDVWVLTDAALHPLAVARLLNGHDPHGIVRRVIQVGDPATPPYVLRLLLPTVPGWDAYARVLYLDADALPVHPRLRDLLLKTDPDPDPRGVLHVYRETDDLNSVFHRTEPWSPADLARLQDSGQGGFNSGTLFFRPTAAMAAHFAAVVQAIVQDDGFGAKYPAAEQPYLNTYFNGRGLTDGGRLLASYVRLHNLYHGEPRVLWSLVHAIAAEAAEGGAEGATPPPTVLHFVGGMGFARFKRDCIRVVLEAAAAAAAAAVSPKSPKTG
jgi:hypothetical protein